MGADGHDEDPVGDVVAVAGEHVVPLGLDRRQRVTMQADAEVAGEPVERDAPRGLAAERRRHRGGAVHQLGRGGEQLDRGARARQGAQRERAFDRGHPRAGDQDMCHVTSLARGGRAAIRPYPQPDAEDYRSALLRDRSVVPRMKATAGRGCAGRGGARRFASCIVS